jgi:hypothetical protein
MIQQEIRSAYSRCGYWSVSVREVADSEGYGFDIPFTKQYS